MDIDSQKKTIGQHPSPKNCLNPTRQSAVLGSIVLLVLGFIGGALFGTMKIGYMSGETSAVSAKPPGPDFEKLERATTIDPQNADAWARLGNAYFDTEQYPKAITAYETSLSIEPDNPSVITDLGVMYRRNKQPEKAVEMFDKAVLLDPNHEIARMNKGIVMMHDLKDEQGAIQVWEELLSINPIAMFGNGQSVDEVVQHYRQGHENSVD